MELKVTKVGNSLGVLLPKELITNLNLAKGDTLWVTQDPSGYRITPYDPYFGEQIEAAKKIMKDRRNVLRELAK
jgi:putative addiction module antidote